MSLPRRASGVKFFSCLSVTCIIYLLLSIVITFFTNKKLVPSVSKNFEEIEAVKGQYDSIIAAATLVVSSFENQLRVPFLFEDI